MKKLSVIIICFSICLMLSCGRKRISIYNYNEVTLTRIDKDAETFFFYGDFSDERNLPNNYIKATYRGFNHIMSSYIIFNNDKTLTFVDMGDGLETYGNPKYMSIFEHKENIDFINWENKFISKYDSIVRIDNVLEIERRLNKNNKSKILVNYDIN